MSEYDAKITFRASDFNDIGCFKDVEIIVRKIVPEDSAFKYIQKITEFIRKVDMEMDGK